MKGIEAFLGNWNFRPGASGVLKPWAGTVRCMFLGNVYNTVKSGVCGNITIQ